MTGEDLLVDHIQAVLLQGTLAILAHEGQGSRVELGVHNLEGVRNHIIGLAQCTEGGEDLVVDALGEHNPVEGVLKPVPVALLALFGGE